MSCANFDNDGAAKVNILKPGTVSTFSEYALKFCQVSQHSYKVWRVDMVWDEYTPVVWGAKEVESSKTMLRNWNEFLKNDDNKTHS